jgi:DNA modification methylase
MWEIEKLKPYEKNPRSLPDKAVAKVASSLKQFGFQKPIVVDEQGVIIAGHVMWKAAQKAGITRLPVAISSLTPAQAKAYRLADNRTAQETDWLEDLLKSELDELRGMDIDLELTGFDDRELQKLLTEDGDLARAEETPEPPVNPVSVLGDVWLLGNHRIVCGDSTSADDVAKALNGVKPHLMVTDPPYGVNYDPTRTSDNKAKAGKVLNDDRADWTEAWALFPGSVAYVWHASMFTTTVLDSLEATGFQHRAMIIWAKDRMTLGRGHYHWQHEPAWYVVRKGDSGHWCGARDQTTIWNIKAREDGGHGHGTQKPVECMRRPMMNNSSPGQAVYEPFSGSGTTIIAAEMTGRHCHAIELNPAYVDVAVKRWQGFTGSKATLEATGQSFEEVDAERYAKTGAPDNSASCYDAAIAEMRKEYEAQNAV